MTEKEGENAAEQLPSWEDFKIEMDELEKFRSEHKVLYASYSNRKLFITLTGIYIVQEGDKELCRTSQSFIALDHFKNK